ncbi:probable serine/threonine-protein kinase DDB_G0280133 isoform X2 [Ostrinia nubilalis]|uniref:probable serine/threonine-protein kinase DDB_G0280133 isoform X2 n=1 Tax=Ostrinia nubilalis TaxID=29057 RepID=UPI0030822FB1
MKSKRKHQSSSEDSELSDGSEQSSSSSASDSEESSVSEHRYKKKKKRADSSESDSDSDDQKRSKKRKHKKKKKKHGKKKKRANSVEVSDSGEDVSSVSEGEISPKKKRKHKYKHSKRARSSSGSDIEEVRVERRLHSVVKERRAPSEDGSQPQRTYYQKEYRHSQSGEDYEREREVQRFYRGSSKERRLHYEEQFEYGRERNDRPQRYEDHRTQDNYHRKHREENNHHARGEDTRGYNRYNQYEERLQKRREYDDGREFRERRGQPDPEHYRQREYQDKREKYQEYSGERAREEPMRRDRPPRPEKSHPPQERERSGSRSAEGRFRDKRREGREERAPSQRSRDERRERPREEERERSAPKPDAKQKERKSRFADNEDNKDYSWGKTDAKKEGDKNPGEKEKPNFGLSGKLTADQNTVNGVVIKYTQPEDAKQPKRRWRFYPFKGDKALPILYIHRQSAFLLGRDKKVADIPLEHPSVSKQHAALQYRATPFTRADGSQGRRVRPYIIDLDSANGTFVNNKKIEPRRYVELLERDVVKFGFSQREYVLLHENSKDDAQDDDHHDPPELGAAVTTTEQIKRDKRVKEEVAEDGE